jgi:hypothetical protein
MTMPKPTPEELLGSYRVSDECYTIGPFFADGVTILKQQIRALNLVFALAETKRIRNELDETAVKEPARDIAVIGGGVAGMTAAAAAAKLGNNVWHFEQRPELCHLQAGCDTRAVAPHIYDWPKAGSESPYAGLPLLNWQAGTAAEFARYVIKGHEAIEKEAGDRFRLHLGATTFVSGMTVKWDNSLGGERGGSREFQLIIIATGFGIERGVHDQHSPSYWRNDSLNQLTPGVTSEKTEQILVSGTGDGGLIDLLRAKIRGFNQAWIIDDLFSEEPELHRLRDGLERIRSKCSDSGNEERLFGMFRGLETGNDTKGQLVMIKDRLERRLRKDVSAILNGPDDVFPEVLRVGRASLSNAFLVFLLYDLKAFNYVPGGLVKIERNKVTIEYPAPERRGADNDAVVASTYTVDQMILRHGTERDKCLRTLGALKTRDDVRTFEERQKAGSSLTSEPQWKPGYWSLSTGDALSHGQGPREFLPPPSQALVSTFASTLSNILMREAADPESSEFRLTVHRLIRLRDKDYFQQVSAYWGTRLYGEPGRIFDVDVGIVGLVCRSGEPIVLKKTENETWEALWSDLHAGPGSHVRTPHANISSILAFPIFVRHPSGEDFVSLVVYADSQKSEFFDPDSPADPPNASSQDAGGVSGKAAGEPDQQENQRAWSTRLTRLFHASEGFVANCDHLNRKKVIRFATSSFQGIPPELTSPQRALINKFSKKGALFVVKDRIEGYERKNLTATVPLHWDCICRNLELLSDDSLRS